MTEAPIETRTAMGGLLLLGVGEFDARVRMLSDDGPKLYTADQYEEAVVSLATEVIELAGEEGATHGAEGEVLDIARSHADALVNKA